MNGLHFVERRKPWISRDCTTAPTMCFYLLARVNLRSIGRVSEQQDKTNKINHRFRSANRRGVGPCANRCRIIRSKKKNARWRQTRAFLKREVCWLWLSFVKYFSLSSFVLHRDLSVLGYLILHGDATVCWLTSHKNNPQQSYESWLRRAGGRPIVLATGYH